MPLNRGGIADFFVENTISNSLKVPGAKFLGSGGLFCFSSIRKFGSFMNSFAMITSLSELYLRFRRFILLVQTKKKSDFYELWQQYKLMRTMEISEVLPDTYDEKYMHISYTSRPT